jgi:hypothetical protein
MTELVTCWVCGGQETDVRLLSSCDSCGQDYHLNPVQAPGKDCGEVGVVEEDEPVLQFFCQPCIDGTTAELLANQSARP